MNKLSFLIRCPECKASLRVTFQRDGKKRIRCPKCNFEMVVDSADKQVTPCVTPWMTSRTIFAGPIKTQNGYLCEVGAMLRSSDLMTVKNCTFHLEDVVSVKDYEDDVLGKIECSTTSLTRANFLMKRMNYSTGWDRIKHEKVLDRIAEIKSDYLERIVDKVNVCHHSSAIDSNSDDPEIWNIVRPTKGISLNSCFEVEIDVYQILTQLCDAIGALHDAGVLHLDITPNEILYNIETEKIELGDFKRATFIEEQNVKSGNNDYYKAPELFGDYTFFRLSTRPKLTPATDIYSLGAVAFYLLTKSDAPSFIRILNNKSELCELMGRHDVPEGYVKLVQGCMQPVMADRFQSTAEVRKFIEDNNLKEHNRVFFVRDPEINFFI